MEREEGQNGSEKENSVRPKSSASLEKMRETKNLGGYVSYVLSNVTLEPVMFLGSFNGGLGWIAMSQLLNYKSCINDFHQNDTVCNNLTAPEYKKLKEQVTDEVAQFNVYSNLILSLIPALMQFYAGSWADIFGRKRIMYAFQAASIICSITNLINEFYYAAPKEWTLLSWLPISLVGGFQVYILCIFAFLADISEPKQRAFRMIMMMVAGTWGAPAAPVVGAKIFDYGNSLYKNGGYATIGLVQLVLNCVLTIILYLSVRRFHWNPKSKQNENAQKRSLISLAHVKDSLSTFFKPRNGMNRKLLWMLVSMFILQVTPGFAEGTVAYLYTFFRYNWEFEAYSTYQTITSLARVIGMTLFVPIIKATGANEVHIVLGTQLTFIVRCIIIGIAPVGWMYYLGAFVDVLSGYSDPCVRAMIATCVPMEELGKVYSLIAMCEAVIPLFVPQIYSSIFQATKNTVPGSVFFFSMALLCVAYGILLCITILLRGKRLADAVSSHEEPTEKERQGTMIELSAGNLEKQHI